eukprot:4829795-Alexandrium_andersonii.AAC.1
MQWQGLAARALPPFSRAVRASSAAPHVRSTLREALGRDPLRRLERVKKIESATALPPSVPL